MPKNEAPAWYVCRACGMQVRTAARIDHHSQKHAGIPDLPWQPIETRDEPAVGLHVREVPGGLIHGPIGGEVHIHSEEK